jgi:hypothetical protein
MTNNNLGGKKRNYLSSNEKDIKTTKNITWKKITKVVSKPSLWEGPLNPTIQSL